MKVMNTGLGFNYTKCGGMCDMSSRIPREIIGQFRNRRALLWLCQRYELKSGQPIHELGENPNELQARYRQEPTPLDMRIASIHWEAIWSDSAKGIIEKAVRQQLDRIADKPVGTIRRPVVLAADPDEEGQLDTRELLPLYFPLGLLDHPQVEGRYTARPSLRRQSYRFNILRKIEDYPNRVLVILGATQSKDLQTVLATVSDFAPLGLRVLIVWPEAAIEPEIPHSVRVPVYIWKGSMQDFLDRLEGLQVPRADFVAEIRLRIRDEGLPLDESDLFGITDRFTLLLEDDLLPPDPQQVTRAVFKELLRGTEGDWKGYAAGLVFPRKYEAVAGSGMTLTSFLLEKLARLESPSREVPNLTVTLPAQNGSGITTLLRLSAFEVALAGYPVLLLQQDQIGFNIDALAAFLNRLAQKSESELHMPGNVPSLLVFDADHEYVHEAYQVAQTLSARGRRVIVLRAEGTAVDISEAMSGQEAPTRPRVRGRRLRLQPLSSVIDSEELVKIQEHFARIADKYPIDLEAPTLDEWSYFQEVQTFATLDGQQEADSLFWVVLHFFLFNREEPPEGFDNWIQRVYESLARGSAQEATRRIAALSSFRLVTPLTPLLRSLGRGESFDPELIKAVAELDEKSGLISWDSRPEDLQDQVLRFRHPLLAQRLLKFTDPSIVDFPIEIIWPLIESLKGGREADVWLGESIAFRVLRTERRGWTTIPYLEKRLETFRRIPPQVSEYDKAILHHWARALYHSALGDADSDQSDLLLHDAIEKMERAIRLPARPGRDEHPSHLYTTLGSIYFELYKRQVLRGQDLAGDTEWSRAAECFERALDLIADNFQALAAYGYRLVERACRLPDTMRATEEALKALSYLDQAEDIADQPGELSDDDRTFFKMQRGRAWRILDPVRAEREIDAMIEKRQEAGYLIRARQAIEGIDLTQPQPSRREKRSLKQAIDILHRAVKEMESPPSWRTFYLLYRLYSAHPSFKFAFAEKIALMEQLERTDFKWHIRMRFEHAVLCYQNDKFMEGQRRFKRIRALLRQPDQPARRLYDFWRRKDNSRKPREATLVVRRIDSDWRGYGFIEEMRLEVLFRPRHFPGDQPKIGDFRPCIIRFETMGPVAVPTSFPVHAS